MQLKDIREEIDRIDSDLVRLIEERFRFVMRTSDMKTAIEDRERENEVISNVLSVMKDDANGPVLEKIYGLLFEEGKKRQTENIDNGGNIGQKI